jgi:hypothetical protein
MNKRWVIFFIAAIVVVALVFSGFAILGYAWENVGDTYLAVQLFQNKPWNVVGSGVYTDLRPWAVIERINIAQLQWCSVDPEVITNDSQRIGLVVCGTVQRPGLGQSQAYLSGWSSYKPYYVNDLSLAGKFHYERNPNNANEQIVVVDQAGLMQTLAQQAMKVCVGDRGFEEAVIGSARDELRKCIDDQVSPLASGYGGLTVDNVTVPNVILSPEVQASLDAITQSRFAQSLAEQQKSTAQTQADAKLAEEQGKIRVSQGTIQEQARQDAITAKLQAQALAAEQQVISQQNANDLLDAQLQLDVNTARFQAAEEAAKANNADKLYVATILQNNPNYAYWLALQTLAPSWTNVDKVYIPAGTNPLTVIGVDGMPGITVPLAPQ